MVLECRKPQVLTGAAGDVLQNCCSGVTSKEYTQKLTSATHLTQWENAKLELKYNSTLTRPVSYWDY